MQYNFITAKHSRSHYRQSGILCALNTQLSFKFISPVYNKLLHKKLSFLHFYYNMQKAGNG
jgi:hypothetical protein